MLRFDRRRAGSHGMIAGMARSGHDPIAKFIRWLEDARRVKIPNYEAMALATELGRCGIQPGDSRLLRKSQPIVRLLEPQFVIRRIECGEKFVRNG